MLDLPRPWQPAIHSEIAVWLVIMLLLLLLLL